MYVNQNSAIQCSLTQYLWSFQNCARSRYYLKTSPSASGLVLPFSLYHNVRSLFKMHKDLHDNCQYSTRNSPMSMYCMFFDNHLVPSSLQMTSQCHTSTIQSEVASRSWCYQSQYATYAKCFVTVYLVSTDAFKTEGCRVTAGGELRSLRAKSVRLHGCVEGHKESSEHTDVYHEGTCLLLMYWRREEWMRVHPNDRSQLGVDDFILFPLQNCEQLYVCISLHIHCVRTLKSPH